MVNKTGTRSSQSTPSEKTYYLYSYCSGSQAILKYLFLGKSGQELLGDQVIEESADALEDCIVVLTYSDVSIYYNAEAQNLVIPIISSWKNVTEYQLPSSVASDTELAEMFKIDAFVAMTKGKEKTSVPIGSTDPMACEKWPMIQAYGLDEKQQRGFFTMNHTVLDCLQDAQRIMTHIDEYAARRIVYESEPLLRRHWLDFIKVADHMENEYERTVKAEVDFVEDLLSFYDFGVVRHHSRGLAVRPQRGTRLLLGTHSNQTNEKSGHGSAEKCGVGSYPATHFILEAEDPATGLRAGRTYFLASGKLAPHIVDKNALVHTDHPVLSRYDKEPDNSRDTMLLKDIYVLALGALRDALDDFQLMIKSSVSGKSCGCKASVQSHLTVIP